MAAVAFHQREARHVRGPIADINHVLKRDGAQFVCHVVIHILMRFQHAFVDAEDVLRLGRVADNALRESDAAILILAELTAKDAPHKRCQRRAV